MKLLKLLSRTFPLRFAAAVLLGVLSGAAATALLAVIARALSHGPEALAGPFIGVALGRVVASGLAALSLHVLTSAILVDLRLRLGRAVLAAPYPHFERVGAPRVMAALTDDIATLGNSAMAWVDVLVQGTSIVGALVYLMFVSPLVTVVVAAIVAGGWFFAQRFTVLAIRKREAAQVIRARTFRGFRDAAKGTKELKLHRPRHEAFLASLLPDIEGTHESLYQSSHFHALANAGQRASFFLAVAVAVTLLAFDKESSAYLVGAASAILFMQGPLDAVLTKLDKLQEAGVALRELEALGLDLASGSPEPTTDAAAQRRFDSLALTGVTHRYGGTAPGSFALGPIDIRLRPGEILFVVGGNGSGKSTLGKILVGLYPPGEGKIEVDGQPVDEAGIRTYRELFGAIFADGHLFREVEAPNGEAEAAARRWLEVLRLDDKVTMQGRAFSTTALSTGQRKRLALVAALVEDRPAYFFDEWAAEQDPELREHFYGTILPDLKARGKAVVVISHDDRYFGVADRVLKLEDGRVVAAGGAS